MRDAIRTLLVCLFFGSAPMTFHAQSGVAVSPAATVSKSDDRSAQLEQRLETISAALVTTHQQLEQSQQQIQQLQEELAQIKKQLGASQPGAVASSSSADTAGAVNATTAAIEDLRERQDTLEAQVKLHDQTKVESASKYPIRITGLVLFNSYINRGAVDNIDLPALALPQGNGASNGSAGAGFRQTIFGIEGDGPRIAGARTSAYVNLDFLGGLAYGSFGTSAGIVRMRTAGINLDWEHDSIQVGFVTPLISPLSPTSYATVAEPGLAGAGNLWTWAPQLRFSHQIPLQSGGHYQFELGLWDPPSAGYSTNQFFRNPSPGEQSKQPAYEARLSYGASGSDQGLQAGIGGYYSRQSYPYGDNLNSWAGTFDWRLPFGRHFELSGEGYRGLALGGLGGGVYKNVISGIDPGSGASAYRGLNAIGGWSQFKTRFGQSLEANLAMGQDSGFASDFHALVLSPAASNTQLRARNRMAVANLIFKPKTYLILSPEYRRIWTWPIQGAGATADVFTFSAGYQF